MRRVATATSRTNAWLLAVTPCNATRFTADDPAVARTLRAAGAELVDDGAEVEVSASPSHLRTEADTALLSIDATQPEGGGVVTRVARRVVASLYMRMRARRCARQLRERGFSRVTTTLWDLDQQYRVAAGVPSLVMSPRELLPQCAVVRGDRRPPTLTLLEASLAEAAEVLGGPLRVERTLAQEGAAVVITDRAVLRVTIGESRHKLDRQRALLGALHDAKPSDVVVSRSPAVLAVGRTGLADWSLETRMPGSTMSTTQLTGSLLDECIDFLVHLFEVKSNAVPEWTFAAQAELVASTCSDPRHREAAHQLGAWLTSTLDDLPRGFGHGDFWQKNLLVSDGSLSGVVDWDTADGASPPFLDLMHLRLSALRSRKRKQLGAAVLDELLPWASAGGDELNRRYARRIGVSVGADQLEALAFAYWLNQVARRFAMFGTDGEHPGWAHRNVRVVLEMLSDTRRVV